MQVESYIDYEETIMAEEGEDGEFTLFGGGGGRGGGRGRGRGNNEEGRGNKEVDNSFGFPIVDEETDATMKYLTFCPSKFSWIKK